METYFSFFLNHQATYIILIGTLNKILIDRIHFLGTRKNSKKKLKKIVTKVGKCVTGKGLYLVKLSFNFFIMHFIGSSKTF